MKSFIGAISLLFAFTALAEIKTVKIIDQGESTFTDSTKFEVLYCSDSNCSKTFLPSLSERESDLVTEMVMEKVAKQLRRSLYQSGYEVDNWNLIPVTHDQIQELLMTDHSEADGSTAWSQEEFEKLFGYITRDGPLSKTWFLPIMSNYMSGTGIETNVLVYAAKTGWVTVINKFEYAE